MDITLRAYVWARTIAVALRRDEAGEGVISTAMADSRVTYVGSGRGP
jgi:hypothetical protein